MLKARIYRWLVIVFALGSLPLSIMRVRMVAAHPSVLGVGLVALAIAVDVVALVWSLRASDEEITAKRGLLYVVVSFSLAAFIVLFVDYPVLAATERAHEVAAAGAGQPPNMRHAIQQEEDFAIPTDPYVLLLHRPNPRGDFAKALLGAVNPRLSGAQRRGRCAPILKQMVDTGAAAYPAFYTGTVLPVVAWCEDAIGNGTVAAKDYLAVVRFRNVPRADRSVLLADAISDATMDDAAHAVMRLIHRFPPQQRTREMSLLCDRANRRIGVDILRACRKLGGRPGDKAA